MKKYAYPLLTVLIALVLAASGVVIALMPGTVPVHYNFAGEIDRFGSKWEYIIFPAVAAVAGGVFVLAARQCGKKEEKESALTEKILLISALLEVVLFGGMGIFFMWKAAVYTAGDLGPRVDLGFVKVMSMGIGVLLIVLGNLMPKARRNSVFGVRTASSMANDEVWRKSQRFGGFSAVILGFGMVITGIFIDGLPHLILSGAAVMAWAAVCGWKAKQFYKEICG